MKCKEFELPIRGGHEMQFLRPGNAETDARFQQKQQDEQRYYQQFVLAEPLPTHEIYHIESETTKCKCCSLPGHSAVSQHANRFSTLKMEVICSSETSAHTRPTRRHIAGDGNILIYRCENLDSYTQIQVLTQIMNNELLRSHGCVCCPASRPREECSGGCA
jgi:hypothetical protein